MELPIYKIDGSKEQESIEVNSEFLENKSNKHSIYYSIISQMTNNRQGTHSTKTRSMVKGGGRKPYKQKGTGNARSGSNSSPLWRGGGRIFGPKPHDYNFKLPKKVRRLAKISATRYRKRRASLCPKISVCRYTNPAARSPTRHANPVH